MLLGSNAWPSWSQYWAEHSRDVVGVERLVLVGEPDPAVQLGVAGELPVEAGHTDQDQAEIASVEEVPELFQPSGSQAVSLIDDHQLCVALGFFVVELGGRIPG